MGIQLLQHLSNKLGKTTLCRLALAGLSNICYTNLAYLIDWIISMSWMPDSSWIQNLIRNIIAWFLSSSQVVKRHAWFQDICDFLARSSLFMMAFLPPLQGKSVSMEGDGGRFTKMTHSMREHKTSAGHIKTIEVVKELWSKLWCNFFRPIHQSKAMEYLIARESLFPRWKCIKETSLLRLRRARHATYIHEQDISTFYPKWHSTSTIPSCQHTSSIKSKVRLRLMS